MLLVEEYSDESFIYNLMDFAEDYLKKHLKDEFYTDDWQWNDTCFQFTLCRNVRPPKDDYCGTYRFCYDEDEEFYGTPQEQVINWIEDDCYPLQRYLK